MLVFYVCVCFLFMFLLCFWCLGFVCCLAVYCLVCILFSVLGLFCFGLISGLVACLCVARFGIWLFIRFVVCLFVGLCVLL